MISDEQLDEMCEMDHVHLDNAVYMARALRAERAESKKWKDLCFQEIDVGNKGTAVLIELQEQLKRQRMWSSELEEACDEIMTQNEAAFPEDFGAFVPKRIAEALAKKKKILGSG